MPQLPLFLNLAGQPVLVVGSGAAAEAKARLVAEAGGQVRTDPADPAGARIAFVAIDGPAAAPIAADLRARGLLVNVVDQPALCDFTVPAIVDRAPLLVAIGTGGASASLAKSLKERLELLLPAGLGGLAEAIRAARDAVAARHPSVAARRAFWAAALAPGAPLDPLRDHPDPAAAVAAALAAVPAVPAPADVARIAIGPDGADGLTLGELRELAAADHVVAAPGVPAAVLALARRDASRSTGSAPPPGAAGRIVLLHIATPPEGAPA